MYHAREVGAGWHAVSGSLAVIADPWAAPRFDQALRLDPDAGPDRSFLEALPEAVLFILRPRAVTILIVLAAGLGSLMWGWLWLLYGVFQTATLAPAVAVALLMLVVVAAFIARIIAAGTRRDGRMPLPPLSWRSLPELLRIGGCGCLTYAVAMAPLTLAMGVLAHADHAGLPWSQRLSLTLTSAEEGGPAAQLLWILGAGYFPLAMLAFIRSGRLSAILPGTTLRILLTVPHHYAAVVTIHIFLVWRIGEAASGVDAPLAMGVVLLAVFAELALAGYALGLIAACSPQRLHFLRPREGR